MSEQRNFPIYVPHPGTVKISGSTPPRSAGSCAYFFLQQNKQVDFFCIGANANQQATKSMGVFLQLVNRDDAYKKAGLSVAFQPLRFKTITKDATTQQEEEKDCTVWRTFLVQQKI